MPAGAALSSGTTKSFHARKIMIDHLANIKAGAVDYSNVIGIRSLGLEAVVYHHR